MSVSIAAEGMGAPRVVVPEVVPRASATDPASAPPFWSPPAGVAGEAPPAVTVATAVGRASPPAPPEGTGTSPLAEGAARRLWAGVAVAPWESPVETAA